MAIFSIYPFLGISALLLFCLLRTAKGDLDKGGENSQFDLGLFYRISKNNENNVVISPISIKLSLLMIMEGAQGQTAREIETALAPGRIWSRDDAEDIFNYMKPKKRKVVVKIYNHLFLDRKYTINPDYFLRLKKDYLADVSLVNMEKYWETANIMNNWVRSKTRGMVPFIVRDFAVKNESMLYLANAAYFKGIWQYKFRKNLTFKKCFYNHGDECQETKMMMNVAKYKYGDMSSSLNGKALQLFYKDRKHFMLILLPNKRDGINELIEKLRKTKLSDIIHNLKSTRVLLQLPKFTIKHYTGLYDALKNLNVSRIFSDEAELNKMVTQDVPNMHINDIMHAVRISVFEKGVLAATATDEEVDMRAPPDYEEFVVDRPFVFFIMDSGTSTVLFAGKMAEASPFTKNKS